MANYDAFLNQAEGEGDPLVSAARKSLFQAERLRKKNAQSERMLDYYETGWRYYILGCMKYPNFAQVSSMQEDLYESYQKYLRSTQEIHRELFKKAALGAAKYSLIPVTNWQDEIARYGVISKVEKAEQLAAKIVPIRQTTGPIDTVFYYDGPMAKELKEQLLFRWALGAGLSQNMSIANAVTYPGQEYMLLTGTGSSDDPLQVNWRWLIVPETRRITAERLGLNR